MSTISMVLATATPGGLPVDPDRAAGETMLLLAVALGLLLLLATVVGLSMLRRAREDAVRRAPSTTIVRDAWREAGRRARVEPAGDAPSEPRDRRGGSDGD